VFRVLRAEDLHPLPAGHPQNDHSVGLVEGREPHGVSEEGHGLLDPIGASAQPDDALELHGPLLSHVRESRKVISKARPGVVALCAARRRGRYAPDTLDGLESMGPARRELPALGARGEGWVALQSVLLAAVGASALSSRRWPAVGRRLRAAVGVAGVAGGCLQLLVAARALGDALTPWPRPRAGAPLRRSSIYGSARHPIYGGLILLSLGWSAASSPVALVPTGLLAAMLGLKARREEQWLSESHPNYASYRVEVPRRFIALPW
jgi:protein-S-isoprenylcysteine O-methyltransferase Ste14